MNFLLILNSSISFKDGMKMIYCRYRIFFGVIGYDKFFSNRFSSISKLPPVKCESYNFLFGFCSAALMPFSSSHFVYKSAFEAKCLHVQKYILSMSSLYLSLKCSTKKNLFFHQCSWAMHVSSSRDSSLTSSNIAFLSRLECIVPAMIIIMDI